MNHLRGIVVSAVVNFLMVCFGHICDKSSQSCKRHLHLQCVANSIPVALSRTYPFSLDVLPRMDNKSDVINMVVEM